MHLEKFEPLNFAKSGFLGPKVIEKTSKSNRNGPADILGASKALYLDKFEPPNFAKSSLLGPKVVEKILSKCPGNGAAGHMHHPPSTTEPTLGHMHHFPTTTSSNPLRGDHFGNEKSLFDIFLITFGVLLEGYCSETGPADLASEHYCPGRGP